MFKSQFVAYGGFFRWKCPKRRRKPSHISFAFNKSAKGRYTISNKMIRTSQNSQVNMRIIFWILFNLQLQHNDSIIKKISTDNKVISIDNKNTCLKASFRSAIMWLLSDATNIEVTSFIFRITRRIC